MFFSNRLPAFSKICGLVLSLAAIAANGQTAETNSLELNSPTEREIREKETHVYKIRARSGDFVRVAIEQINQDIELRVFAPDGQKIYEADNSNTREEAERASFVAAAPGEFQFEIGFAGNLAGRGAGKSYRIRLAALRQPTDKDRSQIKAEKLYDAGNLLRFKREAEPRRRSLPIFREALTEFQAAGDRAGEAYVFYALGQVQSLLSEFPLAQENFAKSVGIFRQLKMLPQLAQALIKEAIIHFNTGEKNKSLELCLAARDIFRQLGDRRGEAEITGNLGVLANSSDEPRRALEYFEQALPILRAENDRADEARILRSMALTYDYLGEPLKSVELYEKSLAISRELGDRLSISSALMNFGSVLRNLGENTRAIKALDEALEIVRRQGDKRGEAGCLNSLGMVYENLGETETAREFYEKSLRLRRELKSREHEAVVLSNLASLELGAGNHPKALEMFGEVLRIAEEIGDKRIAARALVKLGGVRQRIGERETARAQFEKALPVLREIEDREWEALTLLQIGQLHRQTGDLNRARIAVAEALNISAEMKTPPLQSQIYLETAQIEREAKNFAAAQTNVEKAIEIAESVRMKVSRQDFRASFFSSRQSFYDLYVDVLVKQGKNAEALLASERARARNLLESLGESRADIRAGVAPALLEKEKNLRRVINAKDALRLNALKAKNAAKTAEFEKELNGLLSEYRDAQAEIRRQSPQFAALVSPEPLNLAQIQTQVLDDDSVLLEYFLGAEQSYLFIADRKNLTVHKLPAQTEIEILARRFYDNVKARSAETSGLTETPAMREARLKKSDAEAARSSAELSNVLLGAAVEKIKNKRLLIVGAGVLQYVPFGALQVQGSKFKVQSSQTNKDQRPKTENRFLIETNEIVSLPSASALSALRKSKRVGSTKNLAAVLADPVFSGDDARLKILAGAKTPPAAPGSSEAAAKNKLRLRLRSDFARLHFSRREAEAISTFTPAEKRFVALDFSASAQTANNAEVANSRVVHFATHGFVNSDFPELSGVVLSLVDENGKPQDGYLRLHDIYNLRLNSDLVVLSACETALGKEIRGEGIVGLTGGFMYAGSRSVAASLWKVDDKATAELMRRFYQGIFKENLPPSAALRAAQISLLKDKPAAQPFFWAGFIIQGDWQTR